MTLQHVIYRKEEFTRESNLPQDLLKLFRQLRQKDVTVLDLGNSNIEHFIAQQDICPGDALLLAATDATLAEAKNFPLATIGYLNPALPHQGLYQADFLVEGFEEVDFYFLERVYQRKHDIPWRVIETERCYLREMTLGDLDDLYEMYAEPSMTAYMEPLYEREKEEAYTKAYMENMYRFYGYGMWLVMDRETDELIGRAGLSNFEMDGENFLEMGYAIRVSHQKKGYATEVCEAVIDYARGADLGYEKLHCFVWEGNVASMALLKRLGFTDCGKRWRDGREMLVYEIGLTLR